MFTKIVYLFLVCLVFYTPLHVQASPPNVIECMEDDTDCEQLDIEENNLNSQNDDLFIDTNNHTGTLILDIIKLIFALVLVLALIYIVLKLINNKSKVSTQGRVLENLTGISLGQNKSLQIVRIGSKYYLIGVGENVQLLDEITDEEIKKELANQATTLNGSNPNTFITSLIPSKANQPNKKDFNKLFSNELEKLKQNRKEMIKKQKEDHDD